MPHNSQIASCSCVSLLIIMDDQKIQLFLEEYKELGLCWRHDDRINSIFSSILLPLAFAALTLPFLHSDKVPKWPCALVGIIIITFWFCTYHFYRRRSSVRFSRIWQLEEILDFDSHLRYERELGNLKWSFKTLYLITFVFYQVLATSILIADIASWACPTRLPSTCSVTLIDTPIQTAFASSSR